MTPYSHTQGDILPAKGFPCAIIIPAHGAYSMSVLRNGSAAVSKTAGRSSIPRTGANPSAEGLRAEKASVSAATPRRSVLARAGGFSPILHNAGSPSLRRGATPVRNAGVFDTSRPAAPGVRALHDQTGGRIE